MLWQLDAFKPPAFLGFVRQAYEAAPAEFMGQRFLPHRTVDDLAFEYLLGANRRVAMATVMSFDAEAPIGQRGGQGERIVGELPPIKRKMRISEKEIARFVNPRANTRDQQTAIEQVYNDAFDLAQAVRQRVEWMSMQTLSEDKLRYDEGEGILWTFDYGVNGEFQWDLVTALDNRSRTAGLTNQAITTGGPWNVPATATYVRDLQLLCDLIQRRTGTRPTELVCSLAAANYMLDSAEIKALVRGTAAGTTTLRLSPDEIQSIFQRYKLPNIVPYDAVVTLERPDGSLVDVRAMAENRAFLTQGRPIGEFLHGPTAESRILAGGPMAAAGPGVWANTYPTDEPPAQWTKVAAVAFPTAPEMNRIGQLRLWA